MTELLETVALGIGDESQHDDSCPFCSEEETHDKKNDLKNDSDKLGRSLEGGGEPQPDWEIEISHPMAGEITFPNRLRTNAHHCIPGNESLNPHPKIKKFIEAGSEIEADIGYGLNHAKNGVWLPSYPEEYQVTRTTARVVSWREMTKQFPDMQYKIAVRAMKKAARQFHDRHVRYSDFVSQCLDKICEKVLLAGCECPESSTEDKPWPPPYGLVARLDNVSNRLRNLLLGSDPKRWKDPVFTSRHAKRFHQTGK